MGGDPMMIWTDEDLDLLRGMHIAPCDPSQGPIDRNETEWLRAELAWYRGAAWFFAATTVILLAAVSR
jgi:hypothetical protein